MQAILKCNICGNGSLIPVHIGGRPGEKPQRATAGQCDKCGSILAVNRVHVDDSAAGGGFAVQAVTLG